MSKENPNSHVKAIAYLMIGIGVMMAGVVGSWLFLLIRTHGIEWTPTSIVVIVCCVVALILAVYSWFKGGRIIVLKKENIDDPSNVPVQGRTVYDDRVHGTFRVAWNRMKQNFRMDLIIVVTFICFLILYFYVIEPLYYHYTGQ